MTQNLTPKEMKALSTRAGPGTKVVCLGNVAQIDSPYLTESSSGLSYVVDKIQRLEAWRSHYLRARAVEISRFRKRNPLGKFVRRLSGQKTTAL